MHLTPQTLAAQASSPWIIPNPLLHSAVLGVALTFDVLANLTCSIQHTFDDPTQPPRAVTLSRVTTSLTINDPGHGLNVADNVILYEEPTGTWGPTGASGGTSYDIASITDQNNDLQDDINQIQANATALQTRLQDEFNQLESTMSSLQAEGNQVSKILSG